MSAINSMSSRAGSPNSQVEEMDFSTGSLLGKRRVDISEELDKLEKTQRRIHKIAKRIGGAVAKGLERERTNTIEQRQREMAMFITGKCIEQHKPDKALQWLQRMGSEEPAGAEIIALQGDIHRGRGKYDEALADYESALGLDDKNARALHGKWAVSIAKNDSDLICSSLKRNFKNAIEQTLGLNGEEDLAALNEIIPD